MKKSLLEECEEVYLSFKSNPENLLNFVDEQIANGPKERPGFGPSQVREIDELKIGELYLLVHKEDPELEVGHYEELIRLFSINKESGEFLFTYPDSVEFPPDHVHERFLQDYSVLPYEVGTWQDFNYIAHPRK